AAMNSFNENVITEFRANKGIVGGNFAGVRLLLLHDVNGKTGKGRVFPLLCLRKDESFLLVGSNGGTEKEPEWVANLEAVSEVVVEYGTEELTLRPSVVRERTPERQR